MNEENVIISEQPRWTTRLFYYCIGAVLIAYLAILIGAVWVPQITPLEWINNFNIYVIGQHHFIVGFTEATPKVIAFCLFIWSICYMYYCTIIQHPYAGREHGNAQWGNVKEFNKYFSDKDKSHLVKVNFGDMPEPKKPIYVNTNQYWLADGVYIGIDNKYTSNLNIEIIGPPGTGKSFRVARPILSQLCGSFLVTDPKGELYQQTGQYMEDNGYGVFVLNVESEDSMKNSHHFNPFPYISNESDILSLVEILFKATSKAEGSSAAEDPFFDEMAQVLLTCIFYLMVYTYPPEWRDWYHFVELLNSTAAKTDPKTGTIDLSDENGFFRRYKKASEIYKEKHGKELKGYEDVEKIYTNAPETASSIISSLDKHAKYMKLDCVQELLSDDDLDFINTFGYGTKCTESKTGKYILYIVTSETDRYYDWITSMIYALFIKHLYHLTTTDPSLHQTLPNHLTFLMDEFANVTLPTEVVGWSSTMRSRGISLVPIIQNLLQYKSVFPDTAKEHDKNFRSNHPICLILGGPDPDSCKTLSEEFGTTTIHKKTTGISRGGQGSSSENEDVMEYHLFPAQDIFNMAKDGRCAVRVKGAKPLRVAKVRFEKSPLMPLLTRKNPYKIKRLENNDAISYDYEKSPSAQDFKVYFGKAAEKIETEVNEKGGKIITITEEQIDQLAVLSRKNKTLPGNDASTEEFWRCIKENSEDYLKKKKINEIDFDNYNFNQMMIVQKLKNNGFTGEKIHALDPLIAVGVDYEEIILYFNASMPTNEISDFARRLSYARKEKENERKV